MKPIFYTLAVALFLWMGCNTTTPTEEAKADPHQHNESETQSVVLSIRQAKDSGIETDTASHQAISTYLQVSGKLDVPPKNAVRVSVPMGGFVKKIEMLEGMHVHKGDVLAVIENPDYIQLQQDYLETKTQLTFARADYDRQAHLAKDQVNSQKVLQQALSTYKSLEAKELGLRSKLELLGISLRDLENGRLKSEISLKAPLDGYISTVNVVSGQFSNPSDVVLELVDTRHIHAEVVVFEKDIRKIQKGQLVNIYLAEEKKPRLASVFLVGKSIGANREIRVHCHLEKEDESLLPGMFVKAEIEVGKASVLAVPEAAVVSREGKSFVFIAVKNGNTTIEYTPVEVEKGTENQGYRAFRPKAAVSPSSQIVVKNAYTLLSTLFNKGEGGHHH